MARGRSAKLVKLGTDSDISAVGPEVMALSGEGPAVEGIVSFGPFSPDAFAAQ